MKKLLANVVLLIVSSVLMISILEFAVRIILPWYDPSKQVVCYFNEEYKVPLGEPNSSTRVKTPKGDYNVEVSFNKYGFRDDKDLAQSTGADYFVVGDSFSFGWGLETEKRFSNLLESKINKSVFNISIPSSINNYYDLVLYSKLKGANIGNLIVGLCMANDILDYTNMTKQGESQKSTKKAKLPLKAKLRKTLKSSSAIYLMLSFELQKIKPVQKLFEKAGISRNINQLIAQGPNKKYNQAAIDSSADILQKVLNQAPNSHVLIIPSMGLWVGNNQETERKIHDRFLQKLTENGIDFVNPTPIIDKSKDPTSYYFVSDPHWNAKGHELAAQMLHAAITKPVEVVQ